nr:TcfC E-set like domain-containing protein [Vibrio sp. RE86]
MVVSFETIKLDGTNQDSINSFKQYLEKNAISREFQQKILDDLLIGLDDRNLCLGNISECQIYPETYELVHNYNDKELYLFVAPEVLSYQSRSSANKYHNAESKNNGLINSFDLFVSAYEEQDSLVSLNDDTILGLPYGYLKSDVNVTNSDSGSEVYEAAYHLDVDAYSIKAGHFEFEPEVNSTDFLNNTARLSQNSILFGSSEKLLVGGVNSDKMLNFYVPTSGSVQVFRDDRLIYQNNVSEGQNSISYNELPRGRYEARLEVSSGGEVINSQVYQVYNSNSDSLAEGELDYVFSAGMFADSNFQNESDIVSVENDPYAKFLANYQVNRSFQIGIGGLVSDLGSMKTVGGAYNLIDLNLTAEAVYSQFDNASIVTANLGVPYVNVSYEELNNKNGDPVASFMYGHADYARLSINSSYSFDRGQSIYAVYSLNNDTSLTGINAGEEQESQFVSVGYSTPTILDSRLNLNVDYTDATNETSLSLLWTVPLSEAVDAITGVTSSDTAISQFKTTVRRSDLIDSDSFNTSLEVSNTYDRGQNDMYQDALLSADGSNEYANMNGSISLSTNSGSGINASLSSSQVATKSGIYVTNRKAPAYTLIDIDEKESEDRMGEEKGYFALKKQGKDNSQFIVYEDQTIVPLQDYSAYSATFDSESVDLFNSGDSEVDLFSHPGSVATLAPKISRVVSFITSFNDIAEKPISSIECTGEGCLEVNEMTDGVYRVTVLEGLNFELTSKNSQCLLPYKFTSTNQLNFGQNYCLPIADSQQMHTVKIEDETLHAYYLGAYQTSDELTKAVIKLESLGYKLIQKSVGEFKAIYIARTDEKLPEVIALHQKEIANFKLLAKRLNQANSVSYPLARVY